MKTGFDTSDSELEFDPAKVSQKPKPKTAMQEREELVRMFQLRAAEDFETREQRSGGVISVTKEVTQHMEEQMHQLQLGENDVYLGDEADVQDGQMEIQPDPVKAGQYPSRNHQRFDDHHRHDLREIAAENIPVAAMKYEAHSQAQDGWATQKPGHGWGALLNQMSRETESKSKWKKKTTNVVYQAVRPMGKKTSPLSKEPTRATEYTVSRIASLW